MPPAPGQPAQKASPWHLDEGEELIVDDRTVAGGYSFGIIPERGGTAAGWGDAEIEVAKRGGHDIVRPRHPHNRLRTSYRGTPAYPPNPRRVVTGRYVPLDEPPTHHRRRRRRRTRTHLRRPRSHRV